MGDPITFRMNGEVIDLIPIRAAHTGGDTIVRFENADVIMIGDFYRNYGYPFIDTNNGGSLKGALIGALVVSFVRTAGIQFFPELELAVLYLIAALVLLVRPTGLFGTA